MRLLARDLAELCAEGDGWEPAPVLEELQGVCFPSRGGNFSPWGLISLPHLCCGFSLRVDAFFCFLRKLRAYSW